MDPSAVIASCLFVDVGTTYHAYAYLEAIADGHILVRKTWYVRHRRGWLWDTLLLLEPAKGKFYVEAITGTEIRGEVFKGRDPAQLLETTKLEGRIQEAAEARGVMPVEVQARVWRTEFLGPAIMGLRAPIDPVIAYIVKELYPGAAFPKPSEAHGEHPETHIFDAVAGGMVCLANQLGQKLRLPKRILDGAYVVALQERAKSAARRAAKKMGIKIPGQRRNLSVKQRGVANAKRKATIARRKKNPAG